MHFFIVIITFSFVGLCSKNDKNNKTGDPIQQLLYFLEIVILSVVAASL